jgi:predicted nuclease with TOPRIM domain
MNRQIRGAATVSVVWVIVLLALLLFSGGGIYVFASEQTKNQNAVKTAQAEAAAKEAKYLEAAKKVRELSEQVGFRDDSDNLSESRPGEISDRLKQLRQNHSSFLGDDASTASRMIERLDTRVGELNRELAEAKQQSAAAETSRSATEKSMREQLSAKDTSYADLQKQLQDERDRNNQQETADKARIDELNGRLNAHEAKARAEKEELEGQVATLQGEVKKRDGRITELAKRVETIRLPDEPDGSVVAVSTASTCYIDLGAKDLLRRGTRFKVFTYGKNGAMHEKGMVEVTGVQDSMAECTVVDLKDRFDPISRGDKIAAPNYDPEMPREFVLVGNFPSGYTRAMVADRLRSLGARVAEKVGPATDFLIMGDSGAAAGAEGEGGEEATDEGGGEEDGGGGEASADLQLAQLFRVQIVPVREILEYLKYE